MKRVDTLRILTGLGLKSYEAQIYLACLQLGTAPVARISEASGVARSFCYQAIQDLVHQGLLAASKTASTQHYTALPIDVLYQRHETAFRSFQGALPELRLLQDQAPAKPGVLFLTGEDVLRNALTALPSQIPERTPLTLVWPQHQVRIIALAEELDLSARLLAKGIPVTFVTDTAHLPEKDLTTYHHLHPQRFPLGACLCLFADQAILLSDQADSYVTHLTGSEMVLTLHSLVERALENPTA